MVGSFTVAFTLLLIAVPARALDPHRQLRQYGHQSWQTDSGLPQNTVHAVAQSRDGYIWLATEGGLVRFDGVQFQVYDKQNTSQLRSSFINNLFADGSGALWIATADGLTRRAPPAPDSGTPALTTFTTDQGLPSNSVWSVYQDRSGTLWALTANGLGRFTGSRFEPLPIPQGLSSTSSMVEAPDGSLHIGTSAGLVTIRNHQIVASRQSQPIGRLEIQALAADRAGQLWIGTREGLKLLSAGKLSVPLLPRLSAQITALLADSAGRIWIGTDSGLSLYDSGHLRSFTTREGLPGNRVEGLYEDREHTLWISTDRGLARIHDGQLDTLTPSGGLSSNVVLSIFEDREGSLWLGTETGGINILRDQKFTTYTTDDGISDDLVRSVFQDRRGTIWIGTNGGGVDRFTAGRFASLPPSTGLASNIILALADDPAGDLWVGTPDGLNRIHDGRSTLFTSADGMADDFVRSLSTARDGSLWIGTRRGISHYQSGAFTSYTRMDGLGSDLVGAILEDRDGSLWIGTLGGLSHFNGRKFTNYTTQNGLSSNVVTALYQDPNGTLWIGTNGGGLNRLRSGHIDRFPAMGLPDNIYAILEDATAGNLWLSSNSGVYRVSRDRLNAIADGHAHNIHTIAYGIADGMKISECSSGGHPAAWKLADGTLWFATLKGIAAIDPEHTTTNRQPPLVAIEQVLVDDQPVQAPAPNIGPGHTRFTFQYAGLSFVAPQKVRYQYRLDGFDHEWIDAGTRRTAYYTNIPPGRYTFRVEAANNDGLWNETPTTFSFRVLPHFYQTWWFYLLVALALALIGYGIYRWRVHRVEREFSAVLAERNRIAREIHDTLSQGFVAVSVQLEIVARLLSTSGETARQHLEQARQLVRHSLDEARTSIWDLRSQGTGREDLATRLTRSAERLTATTSIKAQLKVSGTYRPLPANLENELVRIGQEAIHNAVRHGHPQTIAVDLEFTEKLVRMTVSDDGRGFSPHPSGSSPNGHYGLTGMQERAQQIGGRLLVASAPGQGTRITIETAVD
jgi:ligand-binding sensor domain-containing protein/signal transduction histidine kinase